MKQVYYKGEPYDYKTAEINGKRHFQLFREGKMMYSVEQCELDIKSIVSFILDAYYRNAPAAMQTSAAR
jgi:hypothetical protein